MPQQSTKDVWLNPAAAPERRLLAFHRWLSWRIAKLFAISPDRSKLIHQLRAIVLESVRQLNDRGWLLDGPALADHLDTKLQDIHRQHSNGRIRDLYPYFKRAWKQYVNLRAEELRADSMRLGMHISNYTADFQPSIPELETQRHQESLRDRLQRQRKSATTDNGHDQTRLF